jgi:hypothetical protein
LGCKFQVANKKLQRGTEKLSFRKDFSCTVGASGLLRVLNEYREVVKFIILTEYNNLLSGLLSGYVE